MILQSIALCAALLLAGAANAEVRSELYWSDADSGVLNGQRFRLYGVDAPETGPVGRRGGAKCEKERAKGYAAKAKVLELTKDTEIKISKSYGYDKSEKPRLLVDLTFNGRDVGKAGIEEGILAPWPHKGTRKLAPKPDWCSQP